MTLSIKVEREIPEAEMVEAIDGISIPTYFDWWKDFNHNKRKRSLVVVADSKDEEKTIRIALTYESIAASISTVAADPKIYLCCKDDMIGDHLGLGCAQDWDIVLQQAVYGEQVFG